jgi:hypothetical protein
MYQDAQSTKQNKKLQKYLTADISCHLFENRWSHYQQQFVNVQSQYRDVMQEEAGRILTLVLSFVKQNYYYCFYYHHHHYLTAFWTQVFQVLLSTQEPISHTELAII